MKVSILVPVYGVENYIEKCARSLFGQTYGNIEYIFVDDCSPDSSVEVMKTVLNEYPERREAVKILRHQQNKGLSGARNTALDHATGDYIFNVDSDDFIDTDAVEVLVRSVEQTGSDFVVFDMRTVYADKTIARKDLPISSKTEYIRRLLHREAVLGVWGKFIARNVYERGNVRFVEGLNYGEDYVTSPRLAYFAENVVKLDRPLYNYIQYNSGAYTRNINARSVENVVRAAEILDDFFSNVPDSEKYADMLPYMKMRNKLDLLKITSPELRPQIAGLYPELNYRDCGFGNFDKMVFRLAGHGRFRFLDWYVRNGLAVKRLWGIRK